MGVNDIRPDEDHWQWLAHELRHERQQRRLSLADIGDVISADRTTVSHIEGGHNRLDLAGAQALDQVWQTGGRLERIYRYATRLPSTGWLPTRVQLEQRAHELRIYQNTLIPGLFQQEDYARSIPGSSGRVNEANIARKLDRQQVLERESPPRIWAIIDEAALRRPVGGPAVMKAQLSHLLKLAERPGFSIRAVELDVGGYPGLDNSFDIAKTSKEEALFTDAGKLSQLTTDPAEVEAARVDFEDIGVVALTAESTGALIRTIMEGL